MITGWTEFSENLKVVGYTDILHTGWQVGGYRGQITRFCPRALRKLMWPFNRVVMVKLNSCCFVYVHMQNIGYLFFSLLFVAVPQCLYWCYHCVALTPEIFKTDIVYGSKSGGATNDCADGAERNEKPDRFSIHALCCEHSEWYCGSRIHPTFL